jgi:Putative prokaryotic signal transducing protein
VYCPECGIEYREGFTECSDCHVPLEAGRPPEENAGFEPSMDLVVVLETSDRVQAALAKGVLEEAGIPYYVLGQIATLVTDVDPFTRKLARIQVARDREAEARELLQQVLQPVTDAEALGEDAGQ